MSTSHVLPALAAVTVTCLVLTGRWAASRRHGSSTARLRVPGRQHRIPVRSEPVDDAARLLVEQAEQHVCRCWQQIRAASEKPD
ncbi:hypothetical protein [Streptomyces sp. NPDC086787]|uniref:hypothetical protein n=1 Tax=Streptomyces sp. NPDC086787 TaxID=3365759 RepID=UPI0038243C8A